jgi:hypothetical protein
MDKTMPVLQRGISFGGFLGVAFLVVIGGIFSLKLIPAYMEDAQIKSVFNSMAHDPDLQKATPHDIRASFDRRASIDNIKAIQSGDIVIEIDQGRLVLSANYHVKVPFAGNVSLYLDFKPTSDR